MLVYVSILIVSYVAASVTVSINIDNDSTAKYGKHFTDLSTIYTRHFKSAKTVNIRSIMSNNYNFQVTIFSTMLIKSVCRSKAAIINVYKSDKLTPNQIFNYPVRIEKDRSNHSFVNEETISKVQRFSSDPEDVYILVVYDPDSLLFHLENNPDSVVSKARALYSIFFVYKDYDCPRNNHQEIANVLLTFWFKYNILNVVAHAPYSCNFKTVYIYNPFKRVGVNEWGVVKMYNPEQIIRYPYLIYNNLINFNQYPLKIAMFERHPTAIKRTPKGLDGNVVYKKMKQISGFGGLDGAILATLASYLNFTVSNIQRENNYFGFVFPNGTITGSLNQIVRRQVHLSTNGRFITNYNTTKFEFTTPYTNDQICIVVPKSTKLPEWTVVFRCFDLITWLAVLIILAVCTVIWFAERRLFGDRDFSKACLDIYSMLISSNIFIPRNTHLGPFLVCYMLLNVIMAGVFQGSLVRSFTTPTFHPDIDTLKDLDQTNYPIYTSFNIFGTNESAMIKRLHARTRTYLKNVVTLDRVAYGRKIAGVERKKDAEMFLKSKYVGPDGYPLLHIVKECPISYFVAYIVPIGSPLLPRFNWMLRKLIENGLVNAWYQDTVDALILEFQMKAAWTGKKYKPFTVQDLQTPFYILIIGCTASLLLFMLEIFVKLK